MNDLTNARSASANLPATLSEFKLRRALPAEKHFNDAVEAYVLALYETEPFVILMQSLYDDESKEGSVYLDEIAAVIVLRDAARAAGDDVVGGATIRKLHRAVGVVMRRYQSSRNQRREIASASASGE